MDSLLLASSNLLFNLLQPGKFCQGHSVTFSSFPTVSDVARTFSVIVAPQSVSKHLSFPWPLLRSSYSPYDIIALFLSPSPIFFLNVQPFPICTSFWLSVIC